MLHYTRQLYGVFTPRAAHCGIEKENKVGLAESAVIHSYKTFPNIRSAATNGLQMEGQKAHRFQARNEWMNR